MEKLTNKQFLLIVNGPSCGGKSSVCDALLEKYEGIFNAKSDKLKRFISGYNPEIYRGAVHEITKATMSEALKQRLSVIKEGAIWKPEELIEIGEKHGVPVGMANVEAPWEILRERFEDRVEAFNEGRRESNASPERFREIYEMYLETKMETNLQFDSSKQTPEEIMRIIVEYIRTNF